MTERDTQPMGFLHWKITQPNEFRLLPKTRLFFTVSYFLNLLLFQFDGYFKTFRKCSKWDQWPNHAYARLETVLLAPLYYPDTLVNPDTYIVKNYFWKLLSKSSTADRNHFLIILTFPKQTLAVSPILSLLLDTAVECILHWPDWLLRPKQKSQKRSSLEVK